MRTNVRSKSLTIYPTATEYPDTNHHLLSIYIPANSGINFQEAVDFIRSFNYSNPGDCSSVPIKTRSMLLVSVDGFMHMENGKTYG